MHLAEKGYLLTPLNIGVPPQIKLLDNNKNVVGLYHIRLFIFEKMAKLDP